MTTNNREHLQGDPRSDTALPRRKPTCGYPRRRCVNLDGINWTRSEMTRPTKDIARCRSQADSYTFKCPNKRAPTEVFFICNAFISRGQKVVGKLFSFVHIFYVGSVMSLQQLLEQNWFRLGNGCERRPFPPSF
ncbi:hypothetical protein F2P81_004232 [Scophthalmus maximus]|uniref:Uncharacterized protein n=1 Tax=Scophthalmus maximus TaxID=52904 RepID=A0A6A4TCB3_SCOMX|nr:hypothetical protein F2P81_004232 [Scophthalmus maximus]